MHPALPLGLLLLAVPACFRDSEAETAHPTGSARPEAVAAAARASDPVPAAAQADPAVVQEPSLIRGFDLTVPDASARILSEGPISGSRILFDLSRVELGELYQHEEVPFEFPFRIEGDEPVQITVVDSNCGCTDARISADWLKAEGEDPTIEKAYPISDKIAPGARGRLIGTFTSQRYRGDKTTTITVRGSFDNAPLKLEVHTVIRPVFDVTPAQLKFGEVLAGPAGGPRTLDARVTAKAPFTLDGWRRIPVGLKVEPIGEQLPTGHKQEVAQTLRFTLGSDAPEGILSSSAIAQTSLGHDLEVTVLATVVGPIKCTPAQRLVFGIWDQGEARDRTIDVESSVPNMVLPPPTASLEGDAAKVLQVAVDTVEGGRFYRVRVTMPAETPAGSYPGVLRLKFPPDSGLPDKQFTVSGRIREKR